MARQKTAVIVGGGLAGLVAANIFSEYCENVYVIESQPSCGGLLKSTQINDIYFDHGTHILNETHVKKLDTLLFGSESDREKNFITLNHLKTGNYFGKKWDLKTQIPNARNLDKSIYLSGSAELMENIQPSKAKDIETYLKQTLGETYYREISLPIIEKLYGKQVLPVQMAANTTINYFGNKRVLAFNNEITEQLKKIPAFDDKLAYHDDRVNEKSSTRYYYPKSMLGSQYYVDFLVEKAKNNGIQFINKSQVKGIEVSGRNVVAVTLKQGEPALNCDYLFWSVPPVLALKLLNLKVDKYQPKFRTANIFNFIVDKPLLNTVSDYLWVWDKSTPIFRVTLYPNFSSDSSNKITAEVLSDRNEAKAIKSQTIYQDLINMKLIDSDAKLLGSNHQIIHHTFPIPSFEFELSSQVYYNAIIDSFDNVLLSGRFSGKYWLQADILKALYQDILNML